MYANTCWGLLGLSVTFGLAVLGLPTQYEWLSPWFLGAAVVCGVGSLICFGWPLRQRENRAKVAIVLTHPARAVRLIEPSHVIILGLVIAAIGIVWQMRATPPNAQLGANKPLAWVFSGLAGKSDPDGFRVGDIQIWSARNDTGKAVRLIDAYIQSDIDGGKKRPLLLNTYEHGLIPLNQASPIPPDTENITLMAEFPNLSEADFMKAWGKMSFVIQDSDHTVQGKIEERTFKAIFDGYRPKTPAPRPTKAIDANASPKRFYSTADKERISEAFYKLSELLNKPISKIAQDTNALIQYWDDVKSNPARNDELKKIISQLDDLRKLSATTYASFSQLESDYKSYWNLLQEIMQEPAGINQRPLVAWQLAVNE